jgi:hypothetical protein
MSAEGTEPIRVSPLARSSLPFSERTLQSEILPPEPPPRSQSVQPFFHIPGTPITDCILS